MPISAEVCNSIGNKTEVYKCCTSKNKCDLNQGDCDLDTDCSGELVCGSNNCQHPFLPDADCCEKPGNFIMFLKKVEIFKEKKNKALGTGVAEGYVTPSPQDFK